MWLDLRKPGFHTHLEIPILIIWGISYNSGREADACMHEICHDSIDINNLSIHQLLGE